MTRKHRQQHAAKRAQLDHYHALDTAPAEDWDDIDADDAHDQDADFDTHGTANRGPVQQAHQAHGAKG